MSTCLDKARECADEALAAIEDGDAERADQLLRAGDIYVVLASLETLAAPIAVEFSSPLLTERGTDDVN